MEARISQLESELVMLTVALDAEKAYRLELEDERNFLLSENTALRARLATVQVTNDVGQLNEAQSSILTHKSTINISSHSGEKVLQIHQACGDKNAICCAFVSASRAGQPNDIVFCGGVDACVSAYDSLSGSCIGKWSMSAPVLSLDVFGRKVACGMMDGSHAVVSILHGCARQPYLRRLISP
jgi:regulator of replication initiation timing